MPDTFTSVLSGSTGLDYAGLFQMLPERYLVFEAKPPYRFLDVSDAHVRMTGIARESMLGKPFFDIFPDVTAETARSGKSELEEVFQKVSRTGKPHEMDKFRYDIPDSKGGFSERYWKPTHYPLFGKDGEVALLLQSVTDVTQDILHEQRAGRVRFQLEEALSVGFVGSWDWDIPRNVVTTDANLARFFGVEPSRAKAGLPLQVFTSSIHPSDRERVVASIRQAVAHAGRLNEEYRTVDSTGTTHWIIARGRTYKDESGKVVSFSGIIVDVTQRKKAEEVLSYQLLITESIDDAIISLDLDGTITGWNKGAGKMFGYTEKQALGAASEVILDIDPAYDRSAIRSKAFGGDTWRGNIRYRHQNGKTIDVMASVSALMDTSGTPIGLVTIMQDLTKITKAQTDAQQAREKSRAARHEAQLLKHQNEDLLALNRTKDEFIALTSHQLRTPATGTKQYLGMLLEGYAEPLGPRQRSYLQSAYDCNERQLRVVDDILRVAQIDLDKIVLRPEPTDISLFVRQIVDEQSGKFEKRDHSIALHIPSESITLPIDRDRLRMALENITDNADKYTEPGKSITVTVSRLKASVRIAIADQGVGISSDDFPKLFHKFSRIDNPLSVEVGGSGLGLYWAKRIIAMHGGDVVVQSALGKGTTFNVTLPLSHAAEQSNKRPKRSTSTTRTLYAKPNWFSCALLSVWTRKPATLRAKKL